MARVNSTDPRSAVGAGLTGADEGIRSLQKAVQHLFQALALLAVGEEEGPLAPDQVQVAAHYVQVRADVGAKSILLTTSRSVWVMP